MNNIIDIKISGQFLSKSSKNAGSTGSGNSTVLRIEFDNSWAGFAKRIVWRDAKGENETSVLLVPDIADSTNIYETSIPVEATACAGWCSFVIEGYYDSNPSKAIKTASDSLYVAFSDSSAIGEPTAGEVLQLHSEFENLMPRVKSILSETTIGIEKMEENLKRWENYNGDSLYYPGNKVTHNGCCYVCLKECQGIKPENAIFWLMIAQKGEQGQRGMQGPQGVKGEKGDTGEKGIKGEKGDKGDKGDAGERGINGSVVPTNGFYSFDIDANGDLWVHYPDSTEKPEFRLNENGELILTVAGLNGAEFNIGTVKGDSFTYDDITETQKEELTKHCFKFEEGYEDEIDTYGGAYVQKWYRINAPKDEFIIGGWRYYYIYSYGSNSGEFFQMKILDGNNGIYFRTGIESINGFESSIIWNEWRRTLLSDEVESAPAENSEKLITSGGVYSAIGDIETSIENIITKYGLGGETA